MAPLLRLQLLLHLLELAAQFVHLLLQLIAAFHVLLDQHGGWIGATVKNNFPRIYNLRLDPFERMGFDPGESFMSFEHFYGQNFWRLVYLQQEVGKLAQTAIKCPPLQASVSFNLDAVKKKVAEAAGAHGQ